ncbi:MAG: hypothetical protein JO080_14350 [Mucilaginibacter sp.]|nr:hypothetical protein [Mucilaginibacter sp.]
MKSISKVVMAAVVAASFTISAQASVKSLPVDTGKMDKMSHDKMSHDKMGKMDHKMSKMDHKMDKMKKGKMSKDTTKM